MVVKRLARRAACGVNGRLSCHAEMCCGCILARVASFLSLPRPRHDDRAHLCLTRPATLEPAKHGRTESIDTVSAKNFGALIAMSYGVAAGLHHVPDNTARNSSRLMRSRATETRTQMF